MSPQALQRVLGPSGPRRIIGVDFSLIPQCRQLTRQYSKESYVRGSIGIQVQCLVLKTVMPRLIDAKTGAQILISNIKDNILNKE